MATSRSSALSIKITIPIVLIAVLTISLTGFLNQGKFERTITELEDARIRFAVNDIRTNLETGLGLGLPLQGLANAQQVIDVVAQKDPSIRSIVIYDENGSIAFRTGNFGGSAITETWRTAAIDKDERNWQVTEPGAFVIGASLSSAIGTPAGGIALSYSRHVHDSIVLSVARSLRFASLVTSLVTILVAIGGIHFLVARTDRKLKHIEQLLEPESLKSGEPLPKHGDSEALTLVADVVHTSRAALKDLAPDESARGAR